MTGVRTCALPICRSLCRGPFAGAAKRHHTAHRFQMPCNLCRIAGQATGHQQRVGDDEVGKVIGVGDVGEVGLMNRNSMAIQTGRRKQTSRLGHFAGVRLDAINLQVAAFGEFVRQSSSFAAKYQTKTTFRVGVFQNLFGGVGVCFREFEIGRASWRERV